MRDDILVWSRPGAFLRISDARENTEVMRAIEGMEGALVDANAALVQYRDTQNSDRRVRDDAPLRDQWLADKLLRETVEEEFNRTLGAVSFDDLPAWHARRSVVDVEVRRRDISANGLPRSYIHALRHMSAEMFVIRLREFLGYFSYLAEHSKKSKEIAGIKNYLDSKFPDLCEVRNSIAHADERIRGIGPWKKPFKTQPVKNEFLDGVAIVAGLLSNDDLVWTLGNGAQGRISISVSSLNIFSLALQELYQLFPWSGGAVVFPS